MYSMNTSEQRFETRFRDRFASRSYLAHLERKNFVFDTKLKYNKYEADGKSIFVVTLSTYVSSEGIAKSDRMRKFWDREFLYRVTDQLPYTLKESIDYDYVIERSDEGHYHYHGLLAMPREAGDRIWRNGMLNKELDRDLVALRKKGQYRDFAVNSFLIEPIRPGLTVDHWVHYVSKTHDYIASWN
jgi:hypothetical protein